MQSIAVLLIKSVLSWIFFLFSSDYDEPESLEPICTYDYEHGAKRAASRWGSDIGIGDKGIVNICIVKFLKEF